METDNPVNGAAALNFANFQELAITANSADRHNVCLGAEEDCRDLAPSVGRGTDLEGNPNTLIWKGSIYFCCDCVDRWISISKDRFKEI